MERKLVKQGRNALTVTLPSKWLKARGLSVGDVVHLSERNQDILVGVRLRRAKNEITLDVRGFARSLVYHAVQGRYVEGYDTITLLHDNPQVASEQVNSLLGMIIESHTKNKTVLKNIIVEPEENFDALLRRSGHILVEQVKALEEVSKGKSALDDVKALERLLDHNLLYCFRYLNKYESTQHAYKYFLLCATLESAGDQITELAKYIKNEKPLATKVVKGVEEYSKYLFGEDLKSAYSALRRFRNSIRNKTFAEGIAYSLAETLYNFIGFQIEFKGTEQY